MAAEVFNWNVENTTELITESLKFPCLYDVRSKDYKSTEIGESSVSILF